MQEKPHVVQFHSRVVKYLLWKRVFILFTGCVCVRVCVSMSMFIIRFSFVGAYLTQLDIIRALDCIFSLLLVLGLFSCFLQSG